MRDLYAVLGVGRAAGQDEIKQAYRRLVKETHPDLHPGDTRRAQRFREISQAYDILGDADRRARFDRGEIDGEGQERPDPFMRRGQTRGRRRAQPGSPGSGSIFDDIFGRDGFRASGVDLSYKLDVGFVEAALGVRRRVVLSDGRAIDVTVPPGTETGQVLRLRGQGLQGIGGGLAGDALVEVTVEPHPYFTRVGNDIHLEVPVTLHEAVLGGAVEVPTLDGRVSVKVPAGSNSGTLLRLKGRGIADRKTGERGAQLVRLRVQLPEPPDPDLADFLRRWRPAPASDPRAKASTA